LFYRDASGNLVTARVNSAPTFSVGPSTVLFQAKGFFSSETLVAPQYAVAPDDRRFLMLRKAGASTPDKVIVVDNWFEELKATTHK